MSKTLLPCPFCGGEAFVATVEHPPENRPNGYRFHGQIMCRNCQASAGTTGFDLTHEEATRKAIAAWNHRAEPVNKPLTLDEMNALNHEPIYILHMDGHGKWSMNGWHIATASSYRNHGRCDLEIDNGNTIIDMQNYGKTWLAYRFKPERSEG